ncbi:MAG: class I SAM-dependent methyltransferase [Vicingaceae bacterium]
MFHKEIADFVAQNQNKDTAELALLLSKKPDWPKNRILNQINGLQKSTKKFTFLTHVKGFEFPAPRAISQASSESCARFKAQLVSGKSMADLSGGMGIDSYFFSRAVKELSYVEPNKDLFEISMQNFATLEATNIVGKNQTAENFLNENKQNFDWLYLDPDRRSGDKRKVALADCQPQLTALLPQLFEKAPYLLIKLSPLLDLKEGIAQLKHCKKVWVVALKNEVKELLFFLEKGFNDIPQIEAVNLGTEEPNYRFSFDDEETNLQYSKPLSYLYEPNAALMKAGAFKSVAQQFEVKKLAPNTHLYTSHQAVEHFPGRVIKIEKIGKVEKGFCEKANVVCRNFPLKPEMIRKKYKIKEGQNEYCYACSLSNQERIFIYGQLI